MPGTILIPSNNDGRQETYSVDTLYKGELVGLQPGLKRQLYFPLMLLNALVKSPEMERRSRSGTPQETGQDAKQTFHDFVNRVALVCQTEYGGDSVSASAVLQRPDKVIFVFSCNDRDEDQMEHVARSLEDILKMVPERSKTKHVDIPALRKRILRSILTLTRVRVGAYLRKLKEYLEGGEDGEGCISRCQRDHTPGGLNLRRELERMAHLTTTAARLSGIAQSSDGRSQFADATIELIEQLLAIRRSESLFQEIVQRAVTEEDRGSQFACWQEMRHITDRLTAYEDAIEAFFRAHELWPMLFDDFEVRYVPSATPLFRLLTLKPPTAEDIVGKITSESMLLEKLKDFAAQLSTKHEMNERLQKRWPKKDTKFVVHAEVQLHRWLETTYGGTFTDEFFRGYSYIGSSKPTCLLCSYYFQEHGTAVEVRPSHRNLYTSWLMHEVFKEEVSACEGGRDDQRERMLLGHRIKGRVIADIKTTLVNKLSERRDHDSTDKYSKDLMALANLSLGGPVPVSTDQLSVSGDAGDDRDDSDDLPTTSQRDGSGDGWNGLGGQQANWRMGGSWRAPTPAAPASPRTYARDDSLTSSYRSGQGSSRNRGSGQEWNSRGGGSWRVPPYAVWQPRDEDEGDRTTIVFRGRRALVGPGRQWPGARGRGR
ncbi:uncharacterized protein DNG_10071 [Cephalotrichum gorgonifer]|uniref:Uncharacterized protein n=1 Tax=Cephalotrichum gorgonifer TaxID=2041049 RepID=A0AAE8N8Z5_9PEZI|nr:uncharacterized protein DNG_10071 [Cephalotrichum gorgonifer]